MRKMAVAAPAMRTPTMTAATPKRPFLKLPSSPPPPE